MSSTNEKKTSCKGIYDTPLYMLWEDKQLCCAGSTKKEAPYIPRITYKQIQNTG